MSNSLFLRLFLLAALVAMLPACAGFLPQEDSLKVNLSGMKPLESTLMEQRFEVVIRVQNRSQATLDVEGLTFDLELNGKDFASGVSNQGVSIAPLSEAVMSINISSTLFGIIRQIQSLESLKTEPFRYELRGTLYTGGSFIGIPFSEQGEIDFRTQPAVKAM